MQATTMDAAVDAKWQRWGYLGGVVFVVLNLIGFFAPGAPPAIDSKAEKITQYFVDHDSGLKLGAILFAFALPFAIWWLASMWRSMARLEPGGPRLALVFVIGMIMSGSISAVGQAMLAGTAIRIDTLGGASELVWVVVFSLYGISIAAIAVHLLAAAALTLRSKFLPAWTGWIALVGAALGAVGTVGAGSDSAVTQFGNIAFLVWMLWILIVSVLLYTRKEA